MATIAVDDGMLTAYDSQGQPEFNDVEEDERCPVS